MNQPSKHHARNLIGPEPSKRVEISKLKIQLDGIKKSISEVMIALAQITPSSIEANFIAGNSFSAFCFLNSIINASSELIIIDPYIDKTIFYRYLSELNRNTPITIVSDSRRLKGPKLAEFESVEDIFKKEYKNYKRVMHRNLHDRYLINEINAYNLGGSIAHAAYNADYSITEISREKRDELIRDYT
ncbi:MAG: hypothetical protein K9G33_14640 [Sneathiella sp.]|nr:hypothetical protein [Sneathiella sp.]